VEREAIEPDGIFHFSLNKFMSPKEIGKIIKI